MSNKRWCPGCGSTLSSIYMAVEHGEPCPECGLPAAVILQVEGAQQRVGDEALKAEVQRLLVENGQLSALCSRQAERLDQIREALGD